MIIAQVLRRPGRPGRHRRPEDEGGHGAPGVALRPMPVAGPRHHCCGVTTRMVRVLRLLLRAPRTIQALWPRRRRDPKRLGAALWHQHTLVDDVRFLERDPRSLRLRLKPGPCSLVKKRSPRGLTRQTRLHLHGVQMCKPAWPRGTSTSRICERRYRAKGQDPVFQKRARGARPS